MRRIGNSLALFFMGIFIMSASVNSSSSRLGMSIGRTVDANEIHYYIQTNKNGTLDKNEPLKIYWKNNKSNKLESMNWIKKRYGYNAIFSETKDDFAKFHIVSYNKRSFTIKKDKNEQFNIFTYSKGTEIIVKRIYVHIEGGTFWIPNVTHVDLYGHSATSGKEVHEIIYP
jgi:hypothetical protein